jgi:hypothetical protein
MLARGDGCYTRDTDGAGLLSACCTTACRCGCVAVWCDAVQEPPIAFPPTYRMEKGRDEYNNKKNQNPSYTDRILYRSLHGLEGKVSVLFYGADMELELVREKRGAGGRCGISSPCLPGHLRPARVFARAPSTPLFSVAGPRACCFLTCTRSPVRTCTGLHCDHRAAHVAPHKRLGVCVRCHCGWHPAERPPAGVRRIQRILEHALRIIGPGG